MVPVSSTCLYEIRQGLREISEHSACSTQPRLDCDKMEVRVNLLMKMNCVGHCIGRRKSCMFDCFAHRQVHHISENKISWPFRELKTGAASICKITIRENHTIITRAGTCSLHSSD